MTSDHDDDWDGPEDDGIVSLWFELLQLRMIEILFMPAFVVGRCRRRGWPVIGRYLFAAEVLILVTAGIGLGLWLAVGTPPIVLTPNSFAEWGFAIWTVVILYEVAVLVAILSVAGALALLSRGHESQDDEWIP